jgi:hypothetical protein
MRTRNKQQIWTDYAWSDVPIAVIMKISRVLLHAVSRWAYSFILKMEVTVSSEASVDFQRTTWRHIAEDRTFHEVIRHQKHNRTLVQVLWCALPINTFKQGPATERYINRYLGAVSHLEHACAPSADRSKGESAEPISPAKDKYFFPAVIFVFRWIYDSIWNDYNKSKPDSGGN